MAVEKGKKTGLNITSRRSNGLLGREEIEFEVGAEQATPTRRELRQRIAALTACDEELVIIGSVSQQFGSGVARCNARIYKSKEILEKTEPEHMVNRNRGIKKAKEKEGAEKPPGAPAKDEGKVPSEGAEKEGARGMEEAKEPGEKAVEEKEAEKEKKAEEKGRPAKETEKGAEQ